MTSRTLTEFPNTLNKECIKRSNTACKRQPGHPQNENLFVQEVSSEFIEDSDKNDEQDNESDLESKSQSESETNCELEGDKTEISKEVSSETSSKSN